MSPPDRTQLGAFFTQIRVSESGCWVWLGKQDANGFGLWPRIPPGRYKPRVETPRAARVAWDWFRRTRLRPAPLWRIKTVCGHSYCINPAHLYQARLKLTDETRARLQARGLIT